MSSVDPFARGSMLMAFRLGERAGGSVIQAEDTRSGKKVALKILARQLPREPGKREGFIREVRLSAALVHPSLINILEIAQAGEALVMVMDWFDGQPISARVQGRALDRPEYFRVACQIAGALKFLHSKNIIHGNVAGDSVLVAASGQARLCGLGLNNLVRRQGQPSAFQQKGSDARAVAYMSPEQISNQPLTIQSDIFSLGLVLYEAATGKLAYQGSNAAEIGRKVVEEQPPSPKSIDPNIDNAVLGLMGRCLFKDPFRRFKDTKMMLEEIARADPGAAKFAADLAKAAAGPSAGGPPAQVRGSILFLGDVANYAALQSSDPAAAARAVATMQQILGEAVYLFDGEVLDPFGARLIASLPSVEKAIEAARKGEFDFSPAQQGADGVAVRLLLHAGDVELRDGKVGGAAVAKGLEVLQALPPNALHISEEFLKKGRGNVRVRDSGARAGVKLYTIVAMEPKEAPEPDEDEELEEPEETPAIAAPAAAAPKKNRTLWFAAAGVVVAVIAAGAGVMLFSKSKTIAAVPAVAPVPASTALPPATVATPRKILLQPFSVDGGDPALAARAESVRLAAIEILRTFPELQIAGTAAPDVTTFTATVRVGGAAVDTSSAGTPGTVATSTVASGPEIVAGQTAVPMLDAASGIHAVVQLVTTELRLPEVVSANAGALNAIADAVAAYAANDVARSDAALRAALKADPNFLVTQLLAMRYFSAQGKEADALTAARAVLAGDPANLEAARAVARASLRSGDLPAALSSYAVVLKKDPSDVEALNVFGRYAYSANDTAKFNAVLRRLASAPATAAIHQPDLLLSAGRIDSAVQSYYTVEEKVPNNPALALKIGRIAVLRHSTPIAEIELKKLQDSDPVYGLHILKAYLAAQAGSKAGADNELKAALAGAKPGDDYWTNVAEVAVLSGDSKGVLGALKRAVDQKEPTGQYILSNPLFAFLADDPEYQKLREKILAEQNEVRGALAAVPL